MHRLFISAALLVALVASPAMADTVDVKGEGFFTILDRATGQEEDLGDWIFEIETATDRNSGRVFWLTGIYYDGDTSDEYGTFEGVLVYDRMNEVWVMDLHLVCTPCDPHYESDVRLMSTGDHNVWQGYWWDCLTEGNGNFGQGEIVFPGFVDALPELEEVSEPVVEEKQQGVKK
jgi:hypothetical protein